jgi:two-component system response regulator YesN
MENKVVIFLYVPKDFDITSLMDEIFLLLSTRISSAVKIGVSNLFSDISSSHTAYNNSILAINSCGGQGGVSYFKSQSPSAFDAENARKLAEILVAKLYSEDIASLKSLCSEYIGALFATYSDLDKIRNSLFETLFNIKNAVLKVDASYKNEAFDSIFPSLARFTEQEDFEEYLSARTVECFLAISESKNSSENPVIKKACKFIEEHLAEDIGLEVLADELGVSPYHLSRLFKEEKGENFINYLTSLRLEKAKKLLGDQSLIIKEISTGVGYNDQNYFTKLFKQKFGLTPTEYRESVGK